MCAYVRVCVYVCMCFIYSILLITDCWFNFDNYLGCE
jgi:hypothetical protein